MSTLQVLAKAIASLTQRMRQVEVREYPAGPNDPDAIHDNVAGEIAAIAAKAVPVNADLLVIEDSAAADAKKSVQIGNLPGAADPNAIHVNVAAEIAGIAAKAAPIAADLLVIEDSAAANAKKSIQIGNFPGGIDSDAIHDNVAGEIAAIAEKVAPVNADLLVIEDSAAGNIKKRVQMVNLPGGVDPNAIHDNVAGEIVAIAEKVAPVDADVLIIEDSAAGDVKKKVQMINLPGGADPNAIHDNVAGEIVLIAEKVAPVDADVLIIEDSAAGDIKKKVQMVNLPGGATDVLMVQVFS